MYIEYLCAQHFRNLASLELSLSPDPVLLVGANAQGKTNILEALALCATARSFRHAKTIELIEHAAARATLMARFCRHEVHHDITLTLLSSQQRSIRVDGRSLRQVTRLLELVNVVAFFPDDLRIVKGSPEERRRFLDRTIANHRPDFVEAALAYAQVIKSRNAILRAASAVDRRLLAVYDEQLVRYGSIMDMARHETLIALAPLAAAHFVDIMTGAARLTLHLESGVPLTGDFPTSFREALARSFNQDRARGMTTVGPHRADLRMYIADRDARQFASQGQQRAIVLALKLAELAYLTSRLGTPPILLLDDVSSELDTERTAAFFKAATALGSQMWVSTTGSIPMPLPMSTQRFTVENGCVKRLAANG
jgi:DNA replication and repair protein RecF